MKTSVPTNTKFKLIYLAIILLSLLLAAGVWMYYKLKLKQIEKDYDSRPAVQHHPKAFEPFINQLNDRIYV